MKPRPNPRKYLIQTRSADGGAWRTIDTASSKGRAVEAMMGAEGLAALRQGDLVQAGDFRTGLAVMTNGQGLVRVLNTERIHVLSIAATWERSLEARLLFEMALAANMDQRRVVAAACAVARKVLHLLPPRNPLPREILELAEEWVRTGRGESSVAQGIYNLAKIDLPANNGPAMNARKAVSYAASTVGRIWNGATFATGDSAMKACSFAAMALYVSLGNGKVPMWEIERDLAPVARQYLTLSSILLAVVAGETLPFDLPRENPRRARGQWLIIRRGAQA